MSLFLNESHELLLLLVNTVLKVGIVIVVFIALLLVFFRYNIMSCVFRICRAQTSLKCAWL